MMQHQRKQSKAQFILEEVEVTGGETHVQQPLSARALNKHPTSLHQLVQTTKQLIEGETDEETYKADEANLSGRVEGIMCDISEGELAPTHKDPKLWRIKCRKGEEKAAVRNLILNVLKEEFTGVKSVVFPESVNGYDDGCVYVEAFTHKDVKEAVECGEGVPSLRKGLDVQETVHVEDMTKVFRVVKNKKDFTDLKPLSWVRLNNKQANFKGDICKVVYNAVKEKKLLLKLIPRLDYTTPRGSHKNTTECKTPSKSATSKEKNQQQERKKFNVEAIRAVGGSVDFGENKFVKFERKWYSRTGFLYHTFSYDAVQSVVPSTLAEANEFEDAEVEDIQLAFEVTSGFPGQFFGVNRNDIAVLRGEPVVPIESEPCKLENNFTDMESERTAAASAVSSIKPITSNPTEGSTTVDYTAASSSNRHRKRGGDDPLLGRLVEITIGPDIGKIGKVTRVKESAVYVQLTPADYAIPFHRGQFKVWNSFGIPELEITSPLGSPTSLAFHASAETTPKSLSAEDELLWYNFWYLDRLPEYLVEGNEVYDNLEEFMETQFNEELTPNDKSSTTAELSSDCSKSDSEFNVLADLWRVSCKKTAEKTIVNQLRTRILNNSSLEIPLIFINQPGFVYIEALQEEHVKIAMAGIADLFPDTLQMIPAREMESHLKLTKKPYYHPGSWVRILRRHHQNDLAQVVSYDIKENTLLLKLVPRIDYDGRGGKLVVAESKDVAKQKSKKRPDPELFDKEKVLAKGGSLMDIDRESIAFEGEVYRSGFLIKMFSATGVRTENPSMIEIENFHNPKANKTSVSETSSIKPNKSQTTGTSTTVPFDHMASCSSNQPIGRGRGGGSHDKTIDKGTQLSYQGRVKSATESTVNVQHPAASRSISFNHSHSEFIKSTVNAAGSRIPMNGATNPPHDGSPTLQYAGMTHGSHGSQSGGSKNPIVSTTPSRRPNVFGNLDNLNPMSHSSSIQGAAPPLDSLTPPASQTTAPQSEGNGSSYVAGFGSRTPMLDSSTRRFGGMTHRSPSRAQPSRAWYDKTANISSRTLNANEESAKFCDTLMQGGGMDGLSSRDWYTTDIQVRFRPDSKNANEIGVIRGISDSSASVFLLSDRRIVNVAGDLLEPVVPNRLDRVKIIRGDQRRGETGTMLQVDQQRGRVRLDSTGEEEMFQLPNLCKMPNSR